jgi:hypothetical protein
MEIPQGNTMEILENGTLKAPPTRHAGGFLHRNSGRLHERKHADRSHRSFCSQLESECLPVEWAKVEVHQQMKRYYFHLRN